jgi:AbrB family looped-hinge helix DNA binding protein
MTALKLRKNAQLTLPAEIRDALKVAEGDYLEAELVEGGVMLRPISIVRREAAWDDLMRIVNEPKWVTPPALTPDEEEAEIFEIVEEYRRENG